MRTESDGRKKRSFSGFLGDIVKSAEDNEDDLDFFGNEDEENEDGKRKEEKVRERMEEEKRRRKRKSMGDYSNRDGAAKEKDPRALRNRRGIESETSKKGISIRRGDDGHPLSQSNQEIRFFIDATDKSYSWEEMLAKAEEENLGYSFYDVGVFVVHEDGHKDYDPILTELNRPVLIERFKQLGEAYCDFLETRRTGENFDKDLLTVGQTNSLKKIGIDPDTASSATILFGLSQIGQGEVQSPTAVGNMAPASTETGWTCPDCGTENTGNFCSNCGVEKPIPEIIVEWVCPKCSTKNTGNFCTGCATKKPEIVTKCPFCGAPVTDQTHNFCSECGKPLRPESSDEGSDTPEGTSKTDSDEQSDKPSTPGQGGDSGSKSNNEGHRK